MTSSQRHEAVTLALIVVFGVVGWGLNDAFGKFGEWLSLFCVIPPLGYYLVSELRDQER
jgi:hypothetical protein